MKRFNKPVETKEPNKKSIENHEKSREKKDKLKKDELRKKEVRARPEKTGSSSLSNWKCSE